MRNKSKKVNKNKLVKTYLVVFIAFIVVFFIQELYYYILKNVYLIEDLVASPIIAITQGLLILFWIYNIIFFIRIIKLKLPKELFFLSLSELLFIFYGLPLSAITSINFISTPIFNTFFKLLQTLFIIYIFIKLRRKKRKNEKSQ